MYTLYKIPLAVKGGRWRGGRGKGEGGARRKGEGEEVDVKGL